ncbi:LOW QUALITY PROTEIN: uncharacterized protein ColSpa_07269 [Colletotrichum spaethianum]|uniref:Uncharacterized protein n=1 Tax=Colletotrichum spaethianum TaxID=700344 RepID=A0AA37LID0_9PEZI|nr:LOW QUALITY PROTEIN: uncharacterized protein ColSpa_07269 [Colletotrichum spaethianum]GKT47088.1 LOW QUALITY PROTEIN: hypothetical protein ColSpa_07269 [Colletotrichum spaethianum]
MMILLGIQGPKTGTAHRDEAVHFRNENNSVSDALPKDVCSHYTMGATDRLMRPRWHQWNPN